jgi:hemin uptake protein HemP
MTEQTEPLRGSPRSAAWTEVPAHRTIASDDLMAGERVIIIRHGKDEYRLRVTASDKLILTK